MAIDPRATTAYAANRFAPRPPAANTPVGKRMTPKQRDFVFTLLAETAQTQAARMMAIPVLPKGLSPADQTRAAAEFTAPARIVAAYSRILARTDITSHELFNDLKATRDSERAALRRVSPAAPQTTPDTTSNVPDGRYALSTPDASNGSISFYRVSTGRPTGRYAGIRFVTRISSDDELRLARQEQSRILSLISEDPQTARALYGQEIGRCGMCNRTLTSEYRTLGIGPECSKKL
jgi:hypothetical protein